MYVYFTVAWAGVFLYLLLGLFVGWVFGISADERSAS